MVSDQRGNKAEFRVFAKHHYDPAMPVVVLAKEL